MKLSIIIPTFNSSKVLGRALNSIICQTFADWEVLVMDGASKDNTGEIVKSYNDERIKFYSEPDKGIYDAMNKGIKRAHGEWLYFLGSDDWLYDKYVLSYFFVDNNFSKYHVLYGDVDSTIKMDNHKGIWTNDKLLFTRCHQAIFYKKVVFKIIGQYNLKYKLCADHDINLKWFLNDKIMSLYVPRIVAFYSDGGASSRSVDERFIYDFYRLICIRGRRTIERKLYLKYLDKWAYIRKQEGHKIESFFILCYTRIYVLFHKVGKRGKTFDPNDYVQ